ncbi:hypothetical protein OCB76_18305 [Bacillus cereus]|nr:hypothetical protein [Bacillus cereus]
MQGNQLRKNAAGAIIHNNINSYPFLNIPMIINKKDGIIYEVLSAGFQANDAVAMITRGTETILGMRGLSGKIFKLIL